MAINKDKLTKSVMEKYNSGPIKIYPITSLSAVPTPTPYPGYLSPPAPRPVPTPTPGSGPRIEYPKDETELIKVLDRIAVSLEKIVERFCD